ncbi:Centromere protein I [Kalmanozyma brasiliensis GHG001]|uniref:Centromere protein I n=1 Tax=Kalmanozyma brasiliensis (strain GHG001) TaxID=1365824 RepID=UPI0028681F5A|nr:Centromere protein I [Kalmanozyma brasiliensis GHG001]KAF6766841.1 Centromere protein I [Kalmanozyma brasiliensis GHG001]
MPALVTSTASSAAAADRLIQELSTALSAPASGSDANSNTASALQNVQKHARSFGFSSKQCEQLVRLALLGRLQPLSATGTSRSARQKAPKTSVSLGILRSVIPKPRAKVGRQAVLDIIASLGPSPGTDTVKVAGLREDDRNTAGPSLGPERLKVDSKVQVAAIKLLSVLLESPSVPLSVASNFYTEAESSGRGRPPRQERQRDQREQERLQRHAAQYTGLAGSLPTSYLTTSAKTTLEKCYSTLFHFLDYQSLRPHLCYLLCRLTKRRHVRHYRITKLMAMRTNSAPEAGISAVLSTYANFYPDLLFPELLGGGGAGSSAIAGGSAAGLKYPDSDWIASVLLAHARCARRRDGETVESDDEAETDAEAGGRAAKKQRLSSKAVRDGADGDEAAITSAAPTSIPIPNLVTIQPLNSAQKAFGTHPSLITELSSLRHLAHSLDRLVLPSQAAAMLGSGFGSRLMRVAVLAGATITNEDSLSQTIPAGRRNRQAEQDLCWARLSDWLESVLSDELGVQTRSTQRQQLKLPATEAEFKRLAALLRRTRYVFELAEQMPVRLEDLTSTVLLAIAQVAEADSTQAHDPAVDAKNVWSERWDQLAREVLPFVPLVTPSDLASFEERFLAPLEVLATSSKVSLDTSAAVLLALSGMLDNWGSRDWSNIGKTLDARHSYRWGIANLDAAIDYTELISSVSARTDALATSLIGLYPRHVLIEHAVLSVYEMLSGPLAGMRASATIPALPLFAFTLHATTLVPVSRLCGLVQDLRSAFEDHNAGTHPAPTIDGGLESKVYDLRSTFFEEENLATLNSNVTLVANLVWLGKLVTGTDVVGGLPAGIDEAVLADLTQRGDDLNLKLATLANTPFSRAMSHISERFANVYCSQRDAESAEHDGGIRGPVTVKTLKAAKKNGIPAGWTHTDFRAYMLDWLDREGAHGMYELLKNILVTFGSQLKSIRGETQAEAETA